MTLLQITSLHVEGLLILNRPPFLLSLLSYFSRSGLVLLVLSSDSALLPVWFLNRFLTGQATI
jgi:hypothetical protein